MKLKDFFNLKEDIGFKIPGTEDPKNYGRKVKQDFAKFFRTWDSQMTAPKMYAKLFSKAPDEIKEEVSVILQDIDEVSTAIEDELYKIQIPDDALGEKLVDFIGENPDGLEKEFESLDWFDKQIAMSIKTGMLENAIRILDQLLEQLEFILGFLGEFKEKPPLGYKMSHMKENKMKIKKSRIRKIIYEEIKRFIKEEEGSTRDGNGPDSFVPGGAPPQCPQCSNPQVDWGGNDYNYQICDSGNPTATSTQAQGWTCPNSRLVRLKNCDTADNQNYYLVTEVDGGVPQVGQVVCAAPNSNLDPVNNPGGCTGDLHEIQQIINTPNVGSITYPKMSLSGGCPSVSTGGACSNLTQPINSNWSSNVQTHGWQVTFECLILGAHNPCTLLRKKIKDMTTKVGQSFYQNNSAALNNLQQRILFAQSMASIVPGGCSLQQGTGFLSPGDTQNITGGGGMSFNVSQWEQNFTANVANVAAQGNPNQPCTMLNNKIQNWLSKISSSNQWATAKIEMLQAKINKAQELQTTYSCF